MVRCLLLVISIFTMAFSSSPYLPLDHWSYYYLYEMHKKGFLPDLNFSIRPFTREEVKRGLEEIPIETLSPADKRMVFLLLESLEADSAKSFVALHLQGGDRLSFYDTASTNYFGRLSGFFAAKPVSGMLSVKGEEYYKTSPSYPWKKDRAMAVRFSDNYVKADWDHFTFMLGRASWLWGPFGNGSLILSDNAFSFDHVYAQFRFFGFGLSQVVGELDRVDGKRRLVSCHRLDFPKWHNLRAGLFESILYARPNSGGLRDFEIRYINPLGIYFFEQMNNQALDTDGNSAIGFDFEWKGKPLNMRGQFLMDDIQVDNQDSNDLEPPQVAGLLGVDLFYPSPLFNRSRYATFEFKKITNRVYNTAAPVERYTYYGLGLADSSNDCEQYAFACHFCPRNDLNSLVELSLLRQGEGRINAYWGDTPTGNLGYRSEKTPSGTVYSKWILSTENRYRPRYNLGILLRLGYEFEENIENTNQENSGFLFGLTVDAELSRHFLSKQN
jgi:hypothetical protein